MINFFKVNFLLLIIHAQLEHDLEISGMSSCLSIYHMMVMHQH